MTYTLNRRRDSDLHLIKQTKERREKEPARLSAGQKGRGKGAAAERPPGGQSVGQKYKQCDCLRKSNGERGVRRSQREREEGAWPQGAMARHSDFIESAMGGH